MGPLDLSTGPLAPITRHLNLQTANLQTINLQMVTAMLQATPIQVARPPLLPLQEGLLEHWQS